jgi:asparagine synthase (glutamine-hydrolysing)
LSILDLSHAADQPMLDNALGLGVVFNGCIYNFKELRNELVKAGYAFFSDGDTEVILKAYHLWGKECVTRFKGMFAFAIWERDTGRVVLARDRLGVKPLYYAINQRSFRFASTLPALLASGDIDTALDPVALHHYFSFHAAVPPPRTIFRGIKKVPPGTLLTVETDGVLSEETYWSLHVGERDRGRSERDWIEAVGHELKRSVERRRVSDVPIGVLLSGGLDSSLLVALLAETGERDLRTFSIGFESVERYSGDEFYYSDIVARAFSTKHQQIRINGDRALRVLPAAIKAMSEPMVSHDAVAFFLLSQEVSKNVKVVQSGQGADEIFGGYSWYPPFLARNDGASEYQRRYFDWTHSDVSKLLQPELVATDASREFVEEFFDRSAAPNTIDKVLELDARVMMVDDPVKRVDNMSMAFGLETRVPFLDHELVELAAQIPARLKVGKGGKYVLKEAARRVLPAEVIDRQKGYFPVPSLRYLRGAFLDYVRDILTQPSARARGLYQPNYVDQMIANPDSHMSPKGHSRLWQAALLEGWLQVHGV